MPLTLDEGLRERIRKKVEDDRRSEAGRRSSVARGPRGGMFQVWAHRRLPSPLALQGPWPEALSSRFLPQEGGQRWESEQIFVIYPTPDPGAKQDYVLLILDPRSGFSVTLTGLRKLSSGTLVGNSIFTDMLGAPKWIPSLRKWVSTGFWKGKSATHIFPRGMHPPKQLPQTEARKEKSNRFPT